MVEGRTTAGRWDPGGTVVVKIVGADATANGTFDVVADATRTLHLHTVSGPALVLRSFDDAVAIGPDSHLARIIEQSPEQTIIAVESLGSGLNLRIDTSLLRSLE